MTERVDVIVIGAGHNGLAAAALLAEAGRRVLVLEQCGQVGGAAKTREFADGFAVSAGAQWLYQLQPSVSRQLGVRPTLAGSDLDTVVLGTDGEHVRYGGNRVEGAGKADGEAFREYSRRMQRMSRLLWKWLDRVPPRLGSHLGRDTRKLLRMAVELRLLGRDDMRELLRLVGMNVYDDLEEHFTSDLLKGGLGLDAVLGAHAGPRSPGTFVSALYRYGGKTGRVALPAGGMGSVSNAFAKAARERGAELRTDTAVRRIVVQSGRVAGVETGAGDIIEASTVVSGVDPKQTVLSLVGARHFEAGFIRRVTAFRCDGTAAKLHLALDGLPSLDEDLLRQRLLIAPSLDVVERAFNPAKYGQCSPEPVMDIALPSLHDETLAPEGRHVLSAIVQYAPYRLDGGWTDEAKAALLETCIERLERYLPGVKDAVIEGELLTPVDLEREFGMTGGHWHHGELALDQFLFTRPFVGSQQYRAPLDGLHFCSAGAHPGGGVTGVPGRNAARAIISGEADR